MLSFTLHLFEEADTAKQNEMDNVITVKSVNNGVANYAVIETARWAISDKAELDELAEVIEMLLNISNKEID